jgi:hypothetical protein
MQQVLDSLQLLAASAAGCLIPRGSHAEAARAKAAAAVTAAVAATLKVKAAASYWDATTVPAVALATAELSAPHWQVAKSDAGDELLQWRCLIDSFLG